MKIAVVAVGYNRPKSLSRILSSVSVADYEDDVVDLIISLDKGDRQAELVDLAKSIEWTHGEKRIRVFSERQGLRPHILQCGALTSEYDAVVVLEDDIAVSVGFYSYCKQMLEYYGNDDRIAGISLYKHRMCPGNGLIFDPAEGKYDVFFMQYAQSWGQCWTKNMWDGFYRWYQDNSGDIVADETFPAYIARWNKASWLKYYDKYVVETNKFYVYPYKSLSTNHTDVGEHALVAQPDFQVPLLTEPMDYRCVSLDEGIKYDIFFERLDICDKVLCEFNGKKILDLMGLKTNFEKGDYLISVQSLPYKVIKELKLQYRPIEDNLLKPFEGKGIFVYDLHITAKKPKLDSNIFTRYCIRAFSWKKALKYGVSGILNAIKRGIVR